VNGNEVNKRVVRIINNSIEEINSMPSSFGYQLPVLSFFFFFFFFRSLG
jgi:hypothetical protein